MLIVTHERNDDDNAKKTVQRRPYGTFAERHADSIQPKRKSESYWKVFAVKTASLRCAVVRASTRICITAGRKR